MRHKRRLLLGVDAFVNVFLGLILLLFPAGLGDLLGLPRTNTYFYPTILGGILFGIGLALFIEWRDAGRGVHGLALPGAIAINLSGAVVLLLWLAFGELALPARGRVALWLVAIVVLGISMVEIAASPWGKKDKNDTRHKDA